MRFVFSCLAGLVLGLAPPVFSANAANLAKEPALQENFYGVQILDSQVWVVGYYGTILHSKDKGLTWEIQQSPTRKLPVPSPVSKRREGMDLRQLRHRALHSGRR